MPPSPATQLRASRISPGAQASSALVYLNLANEFIVLEEQLVPSSGLLDSANSSSRLDGAATTTSPAPMISTPETPSNKSKRKEKEKEKVLLDLTPVLKDLSNFLFQALTSSTSSAELDSSSTSITTQLREGFYKQMVRQDEESRGTSLLIAHTVLPHRTRNNFLKDLLYSDKCSVTQKHYWRFQASLRKHRTMKWRWMVARIGMRKTKPNPK